MADCFFLYYEMINYDVMNSIVLHFYADIEEDYFRASYLENSLANFGDTYTIL